MMVKQVSDWLKKYGIYILLFIGLLLVAFLFGKCSTRSERSQQISNLIAARDSVKQSYVVIDGLKTSVYEQNALILSQKDALAAGIIERDYLKALKLKTLVANAELNGSIKVLRDSLKLVHGTTIITVKDTSGLSNDYIKIPFTLLDENDKNINLLAGMNINKTSYFSLMVPFNGTISIGNKRSGFLKTTPVGIFTTDNPYIKVNAMDVLIVKEPDKWYNKWWIHAIGGIVAFEGVRILLTK